MTSSRGASYEVEVLDYPGYRVVKIKLLVPLLSHSDLMPMVRDVVEATLDLPNGYMVVISGKLPRWVFMAVSYALSDRLRVCVADIYTSSAVCPDGGVVSLPWEAF